MSDSFMFILTLEDLDPGVEAIREKIKIFVKESIGYTQNY
jgi:hypothetical protein